MEQSERLQLNEALLHKQSQQPYSKRQTLKNWMFPRVDTVSVRRIDSRGHVAPPTFITNKIDNSKATVLTFVPRIFWNNFKHFLNFYFLVLAVLQFFPVFQVGLLTRLPRLLRAAHRDHPGRLAHQGLRGRAADPEERRGHQLGTLRVGSSDCCRQTAKSRCGATPSEPGRS